MEISFSSHRKVIVTLLSCVIIVSMIYILSFVVEQRKTSSEYIKKEAIVKQKKVVVERLRRANTEPLTHEELVEAINFVSSGEVKFTDAESREISQILRKQ